MTLIVALRAQAGVVMASDGQATSATGIPTRTSTEKLDVLHGRIAFGCAGSAGLRQRVRMELHEQIDPELCQQPLDNELRDKLFSIVNRIQKHAGDSFVQASPYDKLHTLDVLFAGHSEDESWIYEVTATGDDQRHGLGEAIGHGRHFAAYALVSAEHYQLTSRGLGQVRLLAYRAVDDAIRTDATGLGQPVHMIQLTAAGAQRLSDDQVAAVQNAVNAWQGHECDIFNEQDADLPPVESEADGQGIEVPQG